MNKLLHQHDWRVLVALIGAVGLVSGVVYFRRIAYPTQGDYSLHVLYAQQVVDGRFEDLPLNALAHPALQLLLAGIHDLTLGKLGLYASLMVVQTVAQVLTALVLYAWFGTLREGISNRARAFWAGSLTLVAPVMLLAIWDGQFYYGYIGLANYHNPTIHLLRPFALMSFTLAVAALQSARASTRRVLAAATLTLAAGLIKPNYALIILPAIVLLAVFHYWRRQPLDWRTLGLGFVVPGLLVLSSQWVVAFWLARGEQAGIVVQPLVVVDAFSDFLLPKFLLSILFPLAVLVIGGRDAFRDGALQLAWLGFVAGAAQMYLLAESGDRMFDGNFRWSAQIGSFLLFAASVRYLLLVRSSLALQQMRDRALVYGTYLAHLAAGVAYYVRSLVIAGYG